MLAALLELAPSGVEQLDGEGFVEYAVYGAPGELPSLPCGLAEVAGVRVSVSTREVPDDWAERWRRFHRAVLVAGKLYVRPPWERPALRPGVREIVIDPGQAFGTGTHPTTRMCLELLLEVRPGRALVDLGCGSGVLAIAAAKLGFDPVVAVDSDRAAVEATVRNARANAVRLAGVERLNLRQDPPPRGEVIVANLTRPLLLRVAENMTAEPDTLIVSGLIRAEAEEVADAFAPLVTRRKLTDGGWSALLLGA